MMLQVSFSEKLEVLKDVMSSSVISLVILAIILFIGFLFATTNRHNAKESKQVYLLLYTVCILALIIQYASSLGNMVDYFMNHVFIQIYFPNLAIYVLAIIFSNIIMWKTMFKSDNKTLKWINTIAFCIIHYLLILLLNVISTKGLNVFELTSVYGNKKALALIELSSSTFVLWILLIGIYFLIHKFLNRKKELVLDEIPVESKYRIEKPIMEVEAPIKVLSNKRPNLIEKVEVKEEKSENIYDSMLTVEDYKLLLNLLKEQRHKEQITKEELEEEQKLGELTALYRSVR